MTLPNKETATVILVILTILAVFATIYPLIPISTDKYSAIGLLGPQDTIGNYNTSVTTSKPFLLFTYIQNEEGASEYYKVLVKLGNINTVISNTTFANAPVINSTSYVLLNGQNITIPMHLQINQNGIDLKLIFELWMFQTSTASFIYTGDYNQLFMNVTTS